VRSRSGGLRIRLHVVTRDGDRPTPAITLDSETWTLEAIKNLFHVLAERAGIMAGMASAKIEHNADGRTRLVLWTDVTTSATEWLTVPSEVLGGFEHPPNERFTWTKGLYRGCSVSVLDFSLPICAGRAQDGNKFEPAAPYVYGTAFPIWHGGIFITAAHVYKNAAAAGHVVVGRFATHEGGIPAYFVDHAELWDDLDLAIVRCPMLASFPPVPVDLESHLHVFDEVSALGYPFSVDPEHLIADYRGFAGHIVGSRRIYRLPGQPFGYELSFPSPRGLSGAPLMHLGTDGIHRCYGYIVEQAETQFAGVTTTLGIAVSIDVLRSITSTAGSWRSSIGILLRCASSSSSAASSTEIDLF
jgi:hypothetical protein